MQHYWGSLFLFIHPTSKICIQVKDKVIGSHPTNSSIWVNLVRNHTTKLVIFHRTSRYRLITSVEWPRPKSGIRALSLNKSHHPPLLKHHPTTLNFFGSLSIIDFAFNFYNIAISDKIFIAVYCDGCSTIFSEIVAAGNIGCCWRKCCTLRGSGRLYDIKRAVEYLMLLFIDWMD